MNMLNKFISHLIVYTKVLQWFCSESDNYFLNKIFNYLRIFTDNAPYVESDIDRESLNDLKTKCEKNNVSFSISDKPINSGTVALVFCGYINGEKVAIKLCRNNIKTRISAAKDTFIMMMTFLTYLPFVGHLDFTNEVITIFDLLIEQVNFREEAKNIDYFYKAFKKYNGVIQPKSYNEYCTDKMVVMTFIDGLRIEQLTDKEKPVFLETFVKGAFYVTFSKRIVHLDLHSGNVLFIRDGDKIKISFIDLGLISKISDDIIDLYSDFIKTIYVDLCSSFPTFLKENQKLLFPDLKDFSVVEDTFHNLHDPDAGITPLEMGFRIKNFIFAVKRHKINLNKDFFALSLSMVSQFGIYETIDKNGEISASILKKLIQKVSM